MTRNESPDPVFVFTDPGIDDALALAMATARPLGLSIIGACAVDGNVPARIAAENLAKLFKLFEADTVPIFQSILNDPKHEYPYYVHGKNGLGDVRLPKPTSRITQGVEDFFLSKGPPRFRILSLGPLTAVAELIEKSPKIVKRISECVIMGGAIAKGNVTQYAEFNIYSNPEAADRVFRSDIPKIMVPLDITEKVWVLPQDLKVLMQSKREQTRKVAGMLKFYFEFQRKENGFFGGYMHDPTALVAMIRPGLFRYRRADVRVDTTDKKTRGRTVAKFSASRKRGGTKIAWSVDEEAVKSVIMDTLTGDIRLKSKA